MTQPDARFHISLTAGTFDVSGPEEFVRQQMKQYEAVIDVLLKKMHDGGVMAQPPVEQASSPPGRNGQTGEGEAPALPGAGGDNAADTYPNVFSISEDEIRIISDLPGKAKSEQTVSAALLYLLAKESIGVKRATFKEIQEVCKSHAWLDMSNFSAYIRGAKKEILVSGTRGKLEAELTHPGRRAAQNLAQQLNEA